MAKARTRTAFICRECGSESPKWLGRCPQCNQWNTYVETVLSLPGGEGARVHSLPQELAQVKPQDVPRIPLPQNEFNRVLGGGVVPGSLVLVGGDPGIGKSTLLLQAAAIVAKERGTVLYVSGEESVHQVRLRAERLGFKGEGLYVFPETDLEAILTQLDKSSPILVVIDSIQTVYIGEIPSGAGSIAQVRECTLRLMKWAKTKNIPVFITGHVTKEGVIAGPRVLEHMVDVVLYLEGEPFSSYRLLRGVKNRFGSINEVGIFEMRDEGLVEVENPSHAFLAERFPEAVGSAIIPTLEGTRPLLVEIQALTSATGFSLPRRTANGVDINRLLMIAAVLSKRLGFPLASQDIIVNVVGGLRIGEPAADLGIALAIASSYRNAPVDSHLVAVGEVGLSGELRAVSQLERRLTESSKLGFSRCLLPRSARERLKMPDTMECIGVSSLSEAIRVALPRRKANP